MRLWTAACLWSLVIDQVEACVTGLSAGQTSIFHAALSMIAVLTPAIWCSVQWLRDFGR